MLIFYHEINSIGHKLKKVVGKVILFCKSTDFLIKKVSTLKNLCNVYCFSFAVKRKIRCKITCGTSAFLDII